ncbi:GNAT family N-acetyltransferase [Amycolatopsis sp. FDAARGOS 1241]|uniref:GNAT family N-acetyltransferase n=1 Tax=Amycolatopsis sp. FDAARGOS 1241 TaxID=2778070 RepID=UPI00194F7896|nr:GNAT family protein [Amycolatopsis sp. FDAARGOS 1241]QRP48257.1 GNAT family N-acetyltransferase [Amycolatopsis sp. FDAARGOS 1241]
MEIELRDWSPADAAWYVTQVRDPETLRFTTERATLTVEEFRRALGALQRNENALGFVAVSAESGERLANVAAVRAGDVAEISYWVAAAARGRGVASRAVSALCHQVEAAWPVAELRLWTHADNVASQRVAERAGFGRVGGVTPKDVHGHVWPVVHYRKAVLRSSGPRRRG